MLGACSQKLYIPVTNHILGWEKTEIKSRVLCKCSLPQNQSPSLLWWQCLMIQPRVALNWKSLLSVTLKCDDRCHWPFHTPFITSIGYNRAKTHMWQERKTRCLRASPRMCLNKTGWVGVRWTVELYSAILLTFYLLCLGKTHSHLFSRGLPNKQSAFTEWQQRSKPLTHICQGLFWATSMDIA